MAKTIKTYPNKRRVVKDFSQKNLDRMVIRSIFKFFKDKKTIISSMQVYTDITKEFKKIRTTPIEITNVFFRLSKKENLTFKHIKFSIELGDVGEISIHLI